MKKTGLYLTLIILGSLLIKSFVLWLFMHNHVGFIQQDSGTYIAPAKYILHGGSVWTDPSLWMRTPGYPLFLAAIFKMAGVNLMAVVLVQLLLSSLLIINAYRITAMLSNQIIGLWAAALVGIDYLFIDFFAYILSDLVFAIIISYVFYYLIVFIKQHEQRLRAAFIIGLLLAVATWVRPLPYYLTPLLAIALIVYTCRTKQSPKAIIWLLLLVIPSLLLVGSWQIRNKAVIGTYQYTSIDSVNLYHYYAADIIAHENNISFVAAQQQLDAQAKAQHVTGLEMYHYYQHEGLAILFSHPVLSARQVIVGALHTMLGVDSGMFYYNDNEWQHHEQLHADLYHGHLMAFYRDATATDYVKFVLIAMFYVINLTLIFATFYFIIKVLSSKSNRPAVIACLIVMGYFLLLSANVCGYARFRLPFQLMLDCFTVLGIFSMPYFNKRLL